MASEEAVKYFRYKEQQAFLKWKRICVRSRERQALKELADVDMPDWKKRKLVREVAYYAGCSEFQPLRELDVYEYETEAEPMSDAASYSFLSEDSAIGATEADGESTTWRSSEQPESLTAEPVNETTTHKSTTSQSSKMEETQEETSVGTVYAAIHKPSISRSSEQMESSTAEPVNENTHQSTTSQFSKMEETQPVVSVYAAICKPSISRSSEHTESSTVEPISETTLKSTSSRFSEQVESSLMESVNETARKSTTSQISGQVASTAAESINEELNEDDFETFEEWTISTQNSPERPRRSEDCNSEIANLSPKLAALNIKPETSKGSDARECIEEFAKNPKVRFFKRGKLHKHLKNRFSYETIYRGECSNELLTTLESPDAAAEKSPSMTLLVPNNVQSAVQQLVLQFAERFDCRVVECDASRGSFDERVSHVVVDLEVAEPLQFVQCQAIGCKRHLVVANWLWVSLKEDRIAPLDPYEIFFDDSSVAAPSRVARLSSNDLFDGFAIVMCKPFVNFDASMMERLLFMNGARVCEHPRQLIDSPEQARLCAVDPQFYWEGQKRELLKSKSIMYKFVAVHYAWLFNCFFMYRVQPLLQYLHDATPEEAAEVGVPDSLLED